MVEDRYEQLNLGSKAELSLPGAGWEQLLTVAGLTLHTQNNSGSEKHDLGTPHLHLTSAMVCMACKELQLELFGLEKKKSQ